MAFWLCVGLFLLIAPALLYGLALVVAYLYVRWKQLVARLLSDQIWR